MRELHLAVFRDLDQEFQDHLRLSRFVTARQGSTAPHENVHILGLPSLLSSTHATISGGQVHVKAVIGVKLPVNCGHGESGGELVRGGVEAETYRCCQIIEQFLLRCGSTWDDIMRLTLYLPTLTSSKLEAVDPVVDLFADRLECPAITKSVVGCAQLQLSAAVQLEAVALAPNVRIPPTMPPPPGLEESVETQDVNGGQPDSTPATGKPLSFQEGPLPSTLLEEETADSGGSELLHEVSQYCCTKEGGQFVGDFSSIHVVEMSTCFDRGATLPEDTTRIHDACCRLEMLGDKKARIMRLRPGSILCQKRELPTGQSIWSHTFDVDVVKASSSFINVGLVEWVARPLDGNHCVSGDECTLASLFNVSCVVEPFSGQHRSENPRQMMLGCKKGVKWYGSNTWEHLFKDEVCEGSQLRFLCEYSLATRAQAATHMRLWLQPSQIYFRKRGRQFVRFGRPIFECTLPPVTAYPCIPQLYSLWVPAVTLYSKDDVVALSWQKGESINEGQKGNACYGSSI